MSTALRRLIITIVGLLAGVAAWPLMELVLTFQQVFPSYFLFSLVQGTLFGAVVGAFFGSGEGLTAKERGKIVHGIVLGVATGVAGGAVGFMAGQGVLFLVVQRAFTSYQTQQLVAVPLARMVGWAILGVAVGVSVGLRARSLKKSLVGALGGLIGGTLGGAAIEFLPTLYPQFIYTRLIGLAVFGLLIGLFYSLIEHGVSAGVLRVLNGRRRGKEYSIAQNRMSIGTAEDNDIVLTGYDHVADRHAQFRVRGRDVYLVRERPGDRILINEQSVEEEQLLKYEDVIQLGSAKLWYRIE
jgi:hypothetical protein